MRGIDQYRVRDVIVRAFSPGEFDMFLTFKFDFDRRNHVANGPFNEVVFEVLSLSIREGWEAALIAAVAEERPLKREVQDLYRAYGEALISEVKRSAVEQRVVDAYRRFGLVPAVEVQRAGAMQLPAPESAYDEGLQQTIRQHIPLFDASLWREQLARHEGRVCRIELNNPGGTMGTGFLVGPDMLLTNYHVLEAAIRDPGTAGAVRMRFDYKRLATGATSEGVLVKLHPSDWLVDHSPYTEGEKNGTPGRTPPTPDELDYSLVRLERPLGEERVNPKVSDSPLRGWIRVLEASPAITPKMPLFILQHPNKEPLKLALDMEAVIEVTPPGTRVRYNTNTAPGASGSPCFNSDWALTALHHYGDPAFQHPKYNQGIPIGVIRDRLQRNSKVAALGGDCP